MHPSAISCSAFAQNSRFCLIPSASRGISSASRARRKGGRSGGIRGCSGWQVPPWTTGARRHGRGAGRARPSARPGRGGKGAAGHRPDGEDVRRFVQGATVAAGLHLLSVGIMTAVKTIIALAEQPHRQQQPLHSLSLSCHSRIPAGRGIAVPSHGDTPNQGTMVTLASCNLHLMHER